MNFPAYIVMYFIKESIKMDYVIRKYLMENPIPRPINITLTEKQCIGSYHSGIFWIDDLSSSRNLRHFTKVLNRKIFGNSYYRHQNRLKMLFVREFSTRHHIHGIVERPLGIDDREFVDLIQGCWANTHWGYDHIHFEIPATYDRETGWYAYILKHRTKLNISDSIDWENTYL